MKVLPYKRYTYAEMQRLRELYPGLLMPGFVIRANEDGTMQFVKAEDASALHEWKSPRGYEDTRPMDEVFPKEPIKKRTPQQRVESLVNRWIDDCKRAGGIPGVSEEQVSAVLGEHWKLSPSGITVEDVRKLAVAMLKRAENKYEASEQKKVVRTAPSD